MSNSNPIDDMTQFELRIMKEYLELNDVLFKPASRELESIFESTENVMTDEVLSNPSELENVRKRYLILASKIVDDVRKNISVSESIITEISKLLQRYYGIVFSRLSMVNATNGTLSSIDIVRNYTNCELYTEQLEKFIESKQDLRK